MKKDNTSGTGDAQHRKAKLKVLVKPKKYDDEQIQEAEFMCMEHFAPCRPNDDYEEGNVLF